ncbi:MAG: peptidoglycan-binding domain-containing protein [Isosphaeraceae bacterium]
MEVDGLGYNAKRGICSTIRCSPSVGIRISASVGEGGLNRPDDVRLIQSSLNDIDVEDGGPDPLLDVDGIAGPLTKSAIARFQQPHIGFADSRVDPDGPTLRALNALRATPDGGGDMPVAASAGKKRGGKKPAFVPNPKLVARAVSLLPEIRTLIRAVNFRLAVVEPYVSSGKQEMPKGPFLEGVRSNLKLLDSVFSFLEFPHARPVFENLRRVYRNMDVALNRSFETAPLIAPALFVPNPVPSEEGVDDAYTSAGGAFDGPEVKLRGLGVPANRIYLCEGFGNSSHPRQLITAVHELAHYVSQAPFLIDDQIKSGADFPADRERLNALAPDRKVRNAEHYAWYGFVAGVGTLPHLQTAAASIGS